MSEDHELEVQGSVEKPEIASHESQDSVEQVEKYTLGARLRKIGVVAACGCSLFSDGYQNNITGPVNTIFSERIYPDQYNKTNFSNLFTSMGFVGTIIGMETFGYLADKHGRKVGMVAATLIIFVFAALETGAYGKDGSIPGMFAALVAYRTFIGIGIGAEYPAGSVAASEATEEKEVSRGRHMLFILCTNSMIDLGFVAAPFVAVLLVWICGENHERLIWRLCFGIGVVPPLLVLPWRLFMKEPTRFRESGMPNAPIPYKLIYKRYWKSFVGVSLAWFLYDFLSYPYSIYSSQITSTILGDQQDKDLVKTFGWSTVTTSFYLPGTIGGALLTDFVKPKRMMITFLVLQSIVGFFMSGFYLQLKNHIAGFCVIYGVFLAFGEAGPGNCLGLLSSKSWPTAIRGQYYGHAAAMGKAGAFAGSWAFTALENYFDKHYGAEKKITGPFWVGSGLTLLSAIIVFFLVPEVHPGHMTNEDAAFREYLAENGYDVSLMGVHDDDTGSLSDTEKYSDEKNTHVHELPQEESDALVNMIPQEIK